MPWVTFAVLAASALAMFAGESAFELLVWRCDNLQSGELWRIVSGHLVHASRSHFIWDAAAFALLGSFLERRSRGLLLAVLWASIVGTDFFLRILGSYDVYCGLSGIDMGLFCAASAVVFRSGWIDRDWVFLAVGAIAVLGSGAKIGYELVSSQALFVRDLGRGFRVASEAHLAGFAAGLVSVLAWQVWGHGKAMK